MDANAIITILTGAAGVGGGFFGGKKMGSSQATSIAVDTVELLQVAVGELRLQSEQKDGEIAELRGRVATLEGLVTQRAEVEIVHQEVLGVRGVVDKIASKVGVDHVG